MRVYFRLDTDRYNICYRRIFNIVCIGGEHLVIATCKVLILPRVFESDPDIAKLQGPNHTTAGRLIIPPFKLPIPVLPAAESNAARLFCSVPPSIFNTSNTVGSIALLYRERGSQNFELGPVKTLRRHPTLGCVLGSRGGHTLWTRTNDKELC